MKKIAIMSVIATSYLSASSMSEAFVNGKLSGQIRAAYVDQDNTVITDTYGTSIGGQLKFETAAWSDIKLGIGAYMSQKISFVSGSDERVTHDFFDANGNSFVYIGEGYIDYRSNNLNLCIGRQQIETPFVNGDDVRMLPNTFEGAMAYYSGIDKTTITAGYLYRWAGFDSPQGHHEHINQFNQFGVNHDSNGVLMAGVVNESIENMILQGWIYRTDKVTDIGYTDIGYTVYLDETTSALFLAQYAILDENTNSFGEQTGMDGNVYGLEINLNMGMLCAGISYNQAFNNEGKAVVDGLGGGAYFTSMEEMTINKMEDVGAYRLSAQLNMNDAGIEGLTIGVSYGEFKSVPMNAKITEMDIVAVYSIRDRVSADVSYAKIGDHNHNFDAGKDAGYSRFLARLNYTF